MSKLSLNRDFAYQPLAEPDEESTSPITQQQTLSRDIEHAEHESEDKGTAGVPLYVYFNAIIVAIGGLLFGYDTGVISSAMLLLEQEFAMTALQKGIIVGTVTLGAVFGGAVAGYLSDHIGRWTTSMISALTYLGGAIILSVAYSYSLLVIGRVIIGVGVGLASMVVPIYISEISPRQHRGKLVTLNVLFITGGQVIAYLTGIAFVDFGGWRWMFGVSGIPPLIQLFIMPIVPESPRFLIKRRKNEEAKAILKKLYPESSQEFIDEEIGIIQQTISEDETGSYKQLFHYPNLKPLIIACGLQAFQQLSGFDTAMYYGGTIMKMAGFVDIKEAIIFSLVVSLTNFIFTGVALYIIDVVGRRKILINTVITTILGLVLLGLGFYFITGFTIKQPQCIDYGSNCGACLLDDRCGFSKSDNGVCLPGKPKSTLTSIGKVNYFSPSDGNDNFTDGEFYESCPDLKPSYTWFTLVSLIIYVMAYALGLGHAPWLIQSEIFPLNVRGRATGLATATNWLFNLIITVSFLPLTELITTAGTFWLYALLMIFGWFFIHYMVPETAGLSLEEIQSKYFIDQK